MTVYAQVTACYFTDKNTVASALHTDLHGIDQACICWACMCMPRCNDYAPGMVGRIPHAGQPCITVYGSATCT